MPSSKKKKSPTNKANSKTNLKPVAQFLYETGMLAKTPRSGFFFLGSGEQSVAEHTNRMCYIGYALARLAGDVDEAKVIKFCLFHDLAEARVSDLNYVHQRYNSRQEDRAVKDLSAKLPFGADIRAAIGEYEARESKEAKLARDADHLEFITTLKEQSDLGNKKANAWIVPALKRLVTREGKRLAEAIIATDADEWWFGDKQDMWWVNGGKGNSKF